MPLIGDLGRFLWAFTLKRRAYTIPGPNHCWHINGDDKLKPDGFVIHGCIDGYSRKIIWFIFEQKAQNNFIFVSFVEIIFKCKIYCKASLSRTFCRKVYKRIVVIFKNIRTRNIGGLSLKSGIQGTVCCLPLTRKGSQLGRK